MPGNTRKMKTAKNSEKEKSGRFPVNQFPFFDFNSESIRDRRVTTSGQNIFQTLITKPFFICMNSISY